MTHSPLIYWNPKAFLRFVEPATNRRTDVSKNKPIQRGSTLSGNALKCQLGNDKRV